LFRESYPIRFFVGFSGIAVGTTAKIGNHVHVDNGITPNTYFYFVINLVIAAFAAQDNDFVGAEINLSAVFPVDG
jgi:hypothetical protein